MLWSSGSLHDIIGRSVFGLAVFAIDAQLSQNVLVDSVQLLALRWLFAVGALATARLQALFEALLVEYLLTFLTLDCRLRPNDVHAD